MEENMDFSFDDKDFRELISQFENMLEKHASAYFEAEEIVRLAEYYTLHRQEAKCEEAIAYGLRVHPDNTEVLSFYAQMLTTQGKHDEALKALDTLTDRNDREVLLTKATIYLNKGMRSEADILLDVIAQNNDYAMEVLIDIANLCMSNDHKEEAFRWLKEAYSRYPDNPDVMDALIDYYMTYDEMKKAIILLSNALDNDPYNIDYWISLSHAYINTDNMPKAFEAIDFALAIDNKHPRALETKAFIHVMNDNHDKAIEMLEKMRANGVDSFNCRQLLIQGYVQHKEFEKALEYCNEILSDDLQSYEIATFRSRRAFCNMMLQNMKECKEDIRLGMKADSEYAPLYIVQGEVYLTEEKLDKAKAEFSYAEALAYDKGEALEAIALGFFRTGYMEDAKNAYLRLAKESKELMRKNYYFLAYSMYYSNCAPDDVQTALINAAMNTPEVLDYIKDVDLSADPEEERFFKMAYLARELVQNGLNKSHEDEEQS